MAGTRAALGVLLAAVALMLAGLPAGAVEPASAPAPGKVDFARQIRPILAENCFECHGPEPRGRKGKLRLDDRESQLRDRGGYAVVVPNRPDESELIRRIRAETPDERMPPPDSRRALTPGQVELLERWVAEGAVWSEHWAYAPVVRPAIPAVRRPGWCRNPIDAFVLERLDQAGVAPAPKADRVTLIRRLNLDLAGLPPTPHEVDAFLNDDRPDAYERLVDRLLASPHFGERWAKQWLDLARYADSNGYEDDRVRPDAWRYRDWVIAAFNSDMPFDAFTIAQIAGDLLPRATYTERVAAGFHRMALFNGAAIGRDNEEEFRTKTVKDRASTTATVWLGLTLGCAECHSHKYDPIPQRDYYRFTSFFNNMVDAEVPAPPTGPSHWEASRRAIEEFDRRQAEAEQALAAYEKDDLPARLLAWERSVDRRALPPQVAAVLDVPPLQRSESQAALAGDYFRTVDSEYLRRKAAVLDKEMVKNNRPPPPSTQAMSVGESPQRRPAYVHMGGDYLSPGEPVEPGTPAFLPPLEPQNGTPDRLDLARWLVDRRNPLTSRVAANAVWQLLFGRGLVATPENFGIQGQPPTHPELLDWLATELVSSGWSRKGLVRLIVTSAAYRQSSHHRADLAARDPGNRLLARQNRFRVEAELVRDLGLAAGGLLVTELGGPSIQPPLPDSLLDRPELRSEQLMVPSQGSDRYRRGVYVNVQRTFAYPMLAAFDGADASAACTRRERSNTPQQALALLNDPVFSECARALGLRVLRECTGSREERLIHAFRLCLARRPTAKELRVLGQLHDQHQALYAADGGAEAARVLGNETLPATVRPAEAAAWVAVARTLLNLDEFIIRE
jgi:hypothetical protein